jgi:hypothetical protein
VLVAVHGYFVSLYGAGIVSDNPAFVNAVALLDRFLADRAVSYRFSFVHLVFDNVRGIKIKGSDSL